VPAGRRFGRIFLERYPNALGLGKTPSRFSDPRKRIGRPSLWRTLPRPTIRVCFLEAVLRDQRDGVVGDLPIAENELLVRRYAEIETIAPLRMVDLRDDNAVIMGIPTDVAKGRQQSLARKWSVAFHDHPQKPDGIIHPSRLSGQTNLAAFDHAIVKLKVARVAKLMAAPRPAAVLNDLKISIIQPDP
jgi:hypothetical protein